MKRIVVIFTAFCMAIATAACGSQPQAASGETQPEVQKQYVEAFGIIKAAEVKSLTLDFQAPVTAIHVTEGQKVASGEKLVSLDLSEMQNQLEIKGLELTAAEKAMGRNPSGTDLKKLQNDLKSAQAIHDDNLKELASKEKLYEAGSISLAELDSFKKTVEAGRKAVDDINYAIEGLKTSKGSEDDQKSLNASILEANLTLLGSRLDKPYFSGSDVISDIEKGLVYEIGYTQGDIAGPQKKLLSLLDLDSLVVEANVPEEFIKDVKAGAGVLIVPVADKAREYKGRVTHISGKAVHNNGETLVKVLIAIDGADDFLLPDFNVDVKIQIG